MFSLSTQVDVICVYCSSMHILLCLLWLLPASKAYVHKGPTGKAKATGASNRSSQGTGCWVVLGRCETVASRSLKIVLRACKAHPSMSVASECSEQVALRFVPLVNILAHDTGVCITISW